MRKASEGVRLLTQAIRDNLDEELGFFAEEWEEDTRENRDWEDDTGSAADAITAYRVGVDDPRKNFGSVAWQIAQSQGSQKYGTPPENYRPHIEWVEVGEGANRKVVILTSFIRYMEQLEFGLLAGELITTATEAHRDHFRMRVIAAVSKAIREVSAR